LMRQRFEIPKYDDYNSHNILITIPAHNLKLSVMKAFRGYLDKKILSPSEATECFLYYLDVAFEVYFRGEQESVGAEIDWYVQISFSSCAGLADTSADLGYHWVHMWLQSELNEVNESIFQPAGFIPNMKLECFDENPLFIPLCDWIGYAKYTRTDESPKEYPDVEIDGGHLEGLGEDGQEFLETLEKKCALIFADNQCRCQLCMPQFEPIKIHSDS